MLISWLSPPALLFPKAPRFTNNKQGIIITYRWRKSKTRCTMSHSWIYCEQEGESGIGWYIYKYNIITCKSNTDTKNTDYEHLFKILIVGDSGVGKIMYASPIRWSTIQWIIYYHHCCRFHHQNSFLCPKIITSPESATIQEVYIAQVLIVSTNPNNSNTRKIFRM